MFAFGTRMIGKTAFSPLRLNKGISGSFLYRNFSSLNPGMMRNIGISAHIDSGKTTFTERVLFYTGRIDQIHEVRGSDNVGAYMDSMELEREKGITIQSAATHTTWKDHHINIIDTPGHVDFTIEVERALRVLDGAVLLMCAASGVQPQTLTVDKQMKRYNVPRIVFINKLDRMGANYQKCIQQARDRLNINCAAVQVPIGSENGLKGIIDIVNMQSVYYDGDSGETVRREDKISDEFIEEVKEKREYLISQLAELDEELEELYLMEEEIPTDMIDKVIRRTTIDRTFCPVFMGSAYKNCGIQCALDGVIKYLPNPSEVENIALDLNKNEAEVVLEINTKKPFVGLAFKLEESQFGQLTYIRIYQGMLKKGSFIMNTATGEKLKLARMVRMHSNSMQDIDSAGAGDIVAMFGVNCASGETFTNGDKLAMTSMHVPDPVMSLTIKPKSKLDLNKFMNALRRFEREDPTFLVVQNLESEEIIISGMGELHLFIYSERLRREYDVPVIVGNPTVNYRETVTEKYVFTYVHKKQTGGSGQYAKIMGRVEPTCDDIQDPDADTSNKFVDETKGNNLPNEYIPAIEKAFFEAAKKGPLTGYPVIGTRFVLTDGQTHVVDSSQMAFSLATRGAFREAYTNGGGKILEPIMNVEVTVDAQYQQGIMGGLMKRRGSVTDTKAQDGMFILNADVPLASMFGYATELRGQTQGLGEFSMEYKSHAPVEEYEVQHIVDAYKQKLAEGNDY
jgi:elongation factor G